MIQGQGNLGANQSTFINQAGGTINSNVSGQTLVIDPGNAVNAFVNNGVLEATNGGILLLTGGGGGNFVNNTTIQANGAGTEVQLISSVSIVGGTLSATNGGIIHNLAGQAAFLNGVTLVGPYINDNNADTHLIGSLNNQGTIDLNTTGNVSRLFMDSNITLTGGGTINLNGAASQIIGGFQLTNVDNLIQGQGNLGANQSTFINQAGGTINSNVSGQTLAIDPSGGVGAFVNNGVLEATNGGILLLTGGGGGGFTNTTTVQANGAGTEVQLTSSVTITGGTLSATNGGIIHNLAGQAAFLNGVTLVGPYINDNNADTHLIGSLNNQGTINLNTTGNVSRLFIDSDITLTGGGTINLNGAASQIIGGFQLTNVDNLIQGQGNLGANQSTFINQAGGTINSNVSGQTLVIDPGNAANAFVNNGVLEATNGGVLQLTGGGGGAFSNSGTIQSSTGGVLRFDGTITSSGLVDVGSGTLTGTGNFTQTAGDFPGRRRHGPVQQRAGFPGRPAFRIRIDHREHHE